MKKIIKWTAYSLIVTMTLLVQEAIAETISVCIKQNGKVRFSPRCTKKESQQYLTTSPAENNKDQQVVQGLEGPIGPQGPMGATGQQGPQGLDWRASFEYKIGDTGPGGGFIFYVDYFDQYPDFTYLEAAPKDVGSVYQWCDKTSTSIPITSGWQGDGVGRGQANTNAMLAICASGAASAADIYVAPNGTSDWFLPSWDELDKMYRNLRQSGLGRFSGAWYWSSSETNFLNGRYAWSVNFGYDNTGDVYLKSNMYSVRAVRAF